MVTGSPHRYSKLLLVVLCCLMNCYFYEAKVSQQKIECEKKLRIVFRKSILGMIGAKLVNTYENDSTGFVYSEMKIIHKLITLTTIGSNQVYRDVKAALQLGYNRCHYSELCDGFQNIIKNITDRQNKDTVLYDNFFYSQIGWNNTGNSNNCSEDIKIDFKADATTVLSNINRGYGHYCRSSKYLEQNLDPRTDFYILGVLKVAPSVFGPVTLFDTGVNFHDLEGKRRNVTWVKSTGDIWIVSYRNDTVSDCGSVKLYRSVISNGTLYMLYFRPSLTDEERNIDKTKCIQQIFVNLKEYINMTINMTGTKNHKPYNSSALFVPPMNISTDINLKPFLQDKMRKTFEKDQISHLYDTEDTLYELRTWDYFTNTPENINITENHQHSGGDIYLYSPFVFAVLDKETEILLKTGAFLRPKTDRI